MALNIAKKLKRLTNKLLKILIIPIRGYEAYARHVGVTVGKNCRIYISDFGTEPFLISIGNKVTIASNTKLITHDGSAWLFADDKGRRYQYRRINIGNNVFIGMNCIILPGITIGDNVIIGAGSVITKSVPSGYIAAGNPAKIITDYKSYEKRVLDDCPAEDQMLKGDYKDRVLAALDETYKPLMKI